MLEVPPSLTPPPMFTLWYPMAMHHSAMAVGREAARKAAGRSLDKCILYSLWIDGSRLNEFDVDHGEQLTGIDSL